MNGPICPIRTEADHTAALAEIDKLFGFEPGSPEADRLEVLAVLVAEYERIHEGHTAAHPVEVLSMTMKAQGRTQADLAALIGSRSRASEVLCRRRQLSAQMVETIAKAWAIPVSLLSVPYTVESRMANILKTTTALLAVVVALSAVTIGSVFAWYGADLPTSEQIAATLEGSATNAPGFTPLYELPPEVIKAFLAAEDEDFYAHNGFPRHHPSKAAVESITRGSGYCAGNGFILGGVGWKEVRQKK